MALVLRAVLWLALSFSATQFSYAKDLTIESNTISSFQLSDSTKKNFGSLRYSSGIVFSSDNEKLGGLSGIRVLESGMRFLAISDEGAWLSGDIIRDEKGKITGIGNAQIKKLRNTKGKKITSKRKGDAEGLEIFGDTALVSFERKSRIYSYKIKNGGLKNKAKKFRPSIEQIKLPNNNGLEAISVLQQPSTSKLSTARIAVFSENSLDKNGNIRGFVGEGNKWEEFSVKEFGGYKITDATLLPDDSLLILERQFAISTGPQIRIRRLQAANIVGGALLDGEIIFEADIRHQIDNLEGISSWVNDQGQLMLTMISDNNFSFLQRNVLLEFELR